MYLKLENALILNNAFPVGNEQHNQEYVLARCLWLFQDDFRNGNILRNILRDKPNNINPSAFLT